MSKTTKEILDKFFAETESGMVYFAVNSDDMPWSFRIKLNAIIEKVQNSEHEDVPTVKISNYQKFIEKIDTYLSIAHPFYYDEKDYFDLTDDSYKKKLVSDLFVSATMFS